MEMSKDIIDNIIDNLKDKSVLEMIDRRCSSTFKDNPVSVRALDALISADAVAAYLRFACEQALSDPNISNHTSLLLKNALKFDDGFGGPKPIELS